jgi:hypothetical protein
MRLFGWSLAGLVLCGLPVRADGTGGKVIEDVWEVAYLEDARAGNAHTEVRQLVHNGKTYYFTSVSLNLTVKRNRDVVQLRMETGDTETTDGKVVATYLRQFPGLDKEQLVTGVVKGSQLQLTLDRSKPLKPAPWDPEVVGVWRQQHLLADRKVKPGDVFSFKSFEPAVNLVLRNDVRVQDYENVELLGNTRQRLLRVETKPEKLGRVPLPTLTSWIDENYTALRKQVEIPGVGKITLYRTTKAQATGRPTVDRLTDVGIKQLVPLARSISRPYDTRSAVYRITIAGDDDPASTFSHDKRQQVKNVKGNSFELHIRAARMPLSAADDPADKAAGDEFIKSCYFINSDDDRVKRLARQAVGMETDPWRKAVKIEGWVHTHMRVVNDEGMATADHVARTLRGDCTEFAMLAAAMCRAEGVPSRTAIGLIYAAGGSRPAFAFHMWTEVWIKGRWVPIDATLGRGYVGATHLKVTDHSWSETLTMAPVLPLIRVLHRVRIEVMSVE